MGMAECRSCMGYGHIDPETGRPTIDRRFPKCSDCRGEGEIPMAEETEEKPTTHRVVYTGTCIVNKKPGYHWLVLDENGDPTEDSLIFAKEAKSKFALINRPSIGDIYPINRNGNSVMITGIRERMDWNHPKLREWKLEATAFEAQQIMDKQAASLNIGEMTLEEVKVKIKNTIGHAKRTALIMAVMEFIS